MKTKTSKGQIQVIAIIGVLLLAGLAVTGVAVFTDFSFSVLTGGGLEDCEGDVVTKTFEAADTREAVIEGFTEQENASYAEKVWEQNNFRVVDGEVKYDACTE